MHIKQVRHGDVKPSNLLQMLPVSPFFHVALCDLGLSVPLPKPGAAPPTMGIGTTSYIPPELQDPALAELAAECWGAADVWSAAIMLLVLLKGGCATGG
jgi:serine/threonine protein kinase